MPPATRNAARLIPICRRNQAPPTAKASSTSAAATTARPAMRRRSGPEAFGVRPRNSGAMPTGSMTTNRVRKARPARSSMQDYHHAVPIRPLVLLVPSRAAALEIPRRLASGGQRRHRPLPADPARPGARPRRARAARPRAGGLGLRPRRARRAAASRRRRRPRGRGGPSPPAAGPRAGAHALRPAPRRRAPGPPGCGGARARATDGRARWPRWRGSSARFHAAVDGHFADPAALAEAAAGEVARARWLQDAEVLVVGDLEPSGTEKAFLAALAAARPVRRLDHDVPPGLRARLVRRLGGAPRDPRRRRSARPSSRRWRRPRRPARARAAARARSSSRRPATRSPTTPSS